MHNRAKAAVSMVKTMSAQVLEVRAQKRDRQPIPKALRQGAGATH